MAPLVALVGVENKERENDPKIVQVKVHQVVIIGKEITSTNTKDLIYNLVNIVSKEDEYTN